MEEDGERRSRDKGREGERERVAEQVSPVCVFEPSSARGAPSLTELAPNFPCFHHSCSAVRWEHHSCTRLLLLLAPKGDLHQQQQTCTKAATILAKTERNFPTVLLAPSIKIRNPSGILKPQPFLQLSTRAILEAGYCRLLEQSTRGEYRLIMLYHQEIRTFTEWKFDHPLGGRNLQPGQSVS